MIVVSRDRDVVWYSANVNFSLQPIDRLRICMRRILFHGCKDLRLGPQNWLYDGHADSVDPKNMSAI